MDVSGVQKRWRTGQKTGEGACQHQMFPLLGHDRKNIGRMDGRDFRRQERIGLRAAPALLRPLVERMRKALIVVSVHQKQRSGPLPVCFGATILLSRGNSGRAEKCKADQNKRKLTQICCKACLFILFSKAAFQNGIGSWLLNELKGEPGRAANQAQRLSLTMSSLSKKCLLEKVGCCQDT